MGGQNMFDCATLFGLRIILNSRNEYLGKCVEFFVKLLIATSAVCCESFTFLKHINFSRFCCCTVRRDLLAVGLQN